MIRKKMNSSNPWKETFEIEEKHTFNTYWWYHLHERR